MATINYQDKVALNENPNVQDINKVKDSDLNLIKQVGNQTINTLGLYTDNWSSTGTYAVGDIVINDNRYFQNITGTNTATEPKNDTTNWEETTIILNEQSSSQINTYSCNYINSIIETGSNANGNYIKYVDGTMICYKTVTGSTPITTVWGGGYATDAEATISFGNWPVEFVATPVINVTPLRIDSNYWLGGVRYTTKTSAGYCTMLRFTSSVSVGYNFSVIGIGKWK